MAELYGTPGTAGISSASSTISPTQPVMEITPTQDLITLTANPPITPAANGRLCILVNAHATYAFSMNPSSAFLLAGPVTMGPGDTIHLFYDVALTAWVEAGRSDN